MANEVNIYTPRYLAEVVRQAPPVHTFFRDTFFTNVKKSTTERVDIDLVKGDRRMAAFVHPRVGGKVLKASGYKTESYKPPLVNPCDILYLAAMSGINPELYEAAELDGANRFQQCLHVTIPAILPTISTLLVLNIGSLCGSAAFEKVFLLYTPTTYETADIIGTYVYRMGLGSGNYSYATAVGLFQGVINLVLLTVANKVSSWLTGSGLW